MSKSLILSLFTTAAGLYVALLLPATQPTQRSTDPVELTREEIMGVAARLAEHRWVMREENRFASCEQQAEYESDFAVGDTITGIAYDWGGMDDPDSFDRKLSSGRAAGSHSRHGSTSCTAGIDCSGFVGLCWGATKKFSTQTIEGIGVTPRYNWFEDMEPGDALVKPGSHIVLFESYDATGKPIVYEASGRHQRVVRRVWEWSRLREYYPLQYRNLVDN